MVKKNPVYNMHSNETNLNLCPIKRTVDFNFFIFSGEFLGVYKWLKKLHNRGGTNWDIVHPDVRISIRQFSAEFQDDPFEVCLRDNFELLEDEFFESHKRFQCLENKIEDLKRNLNFQASKIDDLYR